jgi:hypothetical protein
MLKHPAILSDPQTYYAFYDRWKDKTSFQTINEWVADVENLATQIPDIDSALNYLALGTINYNESGYFGASKFFSFAANIFDFLNHLLGLHLEKNLPQRLVAASGEVILNFLGVYMAAVTQDKTLLHAVKPYVLVVNPENLTRSIDYSDRKTAVLFGDGSSAAVVSATVPSRAAFSVCSCDSKPSSWDKVGIPRMGYFQQDGNAVQGFAIRKTTDAIRTLQETHRINGSRFIFVGHQANLGMLKTVCERTGITEQTFYRWRQKFGGLSLSEAQRLRQLERENSRLKRIVADRDLEIDAMKELLDRLDLGQSVANLLIHLSDIDKDIFRDIPFSRNWFFYFYFLRKYYLFDELSFHLDHRHQELHQSKRCNNH